VLLPDVKRKRGVALRTPPRRVMQAPSSALLLRSSLGARNGDIARLVLRSGVAVGAAGVVTGAVLALALGRFAATLLYGVSPRDPLTLGGSAVILLGVACLAAALPAWRAARVDPVAALRSEV